VVYWNSDSGFSVTNVTDFPTGGAVGNTAGDMNGDGKLEIIFNNTMSGHLKEIQNYIYLGNRDANYSPQNRIELPTDWCNGLAFADLDSDGYPETITIEVVPTKTGQRSYLRIYQGTPDGPLPDKFKEFMTNDGFASFAIADFNRDGYLDIFAVCQIYDDKPETLAKSGAIYYGSKDGFSENRFEIIETFGGNVHVADVDNNGYLDLICPDTRGYVLIYLGDKNGYSKNRCWNIPTSGMAFTGSPNTADLNGDGWLDLILTIPGHYMRIEDSLHIYYGSPNGYSSENSQKYLGGYSPLFAAVADYNNDGNLDVFLSAYSSPTTRVLPAKIFWGNGKKIDFEHPLSLMAESSVGALQVDLNRDGWIDLFVTCHRDDIGHQVNSLIFWNGPESFSRENVTLLPGLGPHSVHLSDNGNAYTRKPQESYISEPIRIAGSNIKNISWQADVPVPSKLKFQLRWAKTEDLLESAEWNGPQGNDTYYETSGQLVGEMKDARWIQYKAVFVSPYGCVSPRLSRVSFNYEKQSR
jgi:hypothetical protein